jgi:predicted small lipoprotein YifL
MTRFKEKKMLANKAMKAILVILFLFWMGGCAAKKPVLYPNAQLEKAGQQQAQADIDQCMEMAKAQGVKDTQDGRVVTDSAKSGAVGAAAGAAVAAVWGGDVGRSAAAWGAGAAAGTAVSRAFDSGGPDPVFQGFVNQCLRDKGYQVVGWQ